MNRELDSSNSLEWLQGIAQVSQHAGTVQFDPALFTFLNTQLFIDHFAVFTWSEAEGPGHLFTGSVMPKEEAENLARDYVDSFHTRDPHFGENKGEIDPEDPVTVHPSFQDEYDAEYRDHFFTQHDLVDKISITRKVDERLIYCNFYRIGESGKFTHSERALYDRVLPLLANLIAVHFQLLRLKGKDDGKEHSARSLVHSVISSREEPFDKLTNRESEVCERILLGFTSTGISLDLDIAESSVNTYRRRAYEKLNIATQNELFSLCITTLNKFRY